MEMASLSTRINRPETLWQWLLLFSQICLGWVSFAQLEAMFASDEADDGSLVVYDANGNAHVFLSDEAAGRRLPPEPFLRADARECAVLDVALMKPSCCEAPSGLCHFWDLPKRIGDVLAFLKLRPALTSDPGLVFLAHDQSLTGRSPRGRPDRPTPSRALNSLSLQNQDAGCVPAHMRRASAGPSIARISRERKQAPTGVGRAGTYDLTIKALNSGNDPVLIFMREIGMHWQCEHMR